MENYALMIDEVIHNEIKAQRCVPFFTKQGKTGPGRIYVCRSDVKEVTSAMRGIFHEVTIVSKREEEASNWKTQLEKRGIRVSKVVQEV